MSAGPNYDKKIDFWCAKVGDLPTLPSIVHKTIQVVNDPNSSIRQISEVIGQDPSLSIRILRLANSSFYAVPGGASTIERSITALGIEAVSQMVFSASVFSQFDLQSSSPFNVREFWKHSLAVAMAAETIAVEIGAKNIPLIFLAGLVHDIGKIAHFQIERNEWIHLCEHAQRGDLTIIESERMLHSITHDTLGYELVRLWQLPHLIQEVVQMHHDAGVSFGSTQACVHPKAVDSVYLANLLVHTMKVGKSGHNALRNPPKEVITRTIGNEKELPRIAKLVRKSLTRTEPMLEAMFG